MSGPVPHWKLPPGVTRGVWDYVHNHGIAWDYDAYFADHKLFAFDQQVLIRELAAAGAPGELVADLGCGTARALIPLIHQGFRGLAIDLSAEMLAVVREKAAREQLPIECLQANWVELDAVADASVDHAISMFSSFGMIHGRANRRAALRHTRRILRPGGLLILHVHSYWNRLRQPGGIRWLLTNSWQAATGRWTGAADLEAGDRYYTYRGVTRMYLHLFSRGEIRGELRKTGFRIRRWIPLRVDASGPLPASWWLQQLRAGGWIIVCQAPA